MNDKLLYMYMVFILIRLNHCLTNNYTTGQFISHTICNKSGKKMLKMMLKWCTKQVKNTHLWHCQQLFNNVKELSVLMIGNCMNVHTTFLHT